MSLGKENSQGPGKIVIAGGGPAGMACAYTLAGAGKTSLVIEENHSPGGLCRTLDCNGYLFDIGGHRFISKSEEITGLWQEVMDGNLIRVKRLSRIYYRTKYFNYPLSFVNTFWNLGPLESALCVASYLKGIYFKPGDDTTFEGWISNHFGKRLFNIFFKTYTEKVWEVACKDISADWAKQRMRGLSLRVAIKNTFLKGNAPKTLCEEFLYPYRGPGDFYRRLTIRSEALGVQFLFDSSVQKVRHDGSRIVSVVKKSAQDGAYQELPVSYLFSSIPLPILIQSLTPSPPGDVLQAAERLKFRSFLVANVILDKKDIFPDQWLYIHSPQVKLGRIQNYKNWSKDMVIDANKTTLGLEYFCSEGDQLWNMNDVDLIDYALEELEKVGIVSRRHLINAFVTRCANAYPIYSIGYKQSVGVIRDYLAGFSNFQTIGRAGLFRYDNSDRALLTGIYAARNLTEGASYNLWELDVDEKYLES